MRADGVENSEVVDVIHLGNRQQELVDALCEVDVGPDALAIVLRPSSVTMPKLL